MKVEIIRNKDNEPIYPLGHAEATMYDTEKTVKEEIDNKADKSSVELVGVTTSFTITDSADGFIRNFRAFGNCDQDGTPTPTDSKEIIHWDGLITSKDESGTSTTISTGISLYGIKVSDNGNYIDSNGQQWRCDYVDMNSRKIIRNTKMEFLKSDMDWTASSTFKGSYQIRNWAKDRGISRSMNCILNRFIMQGSNVEYSIGGCYLTDNFNIFPGLDLCPSLADFKLWLENNPTQIVYVLPTPLEEDLDDSQFEKLLQVKTYSHKTTFEFGTLAPFFTIDYWIGNYNGQITANIDAKIPFRFGITEDGRYGYYKVGADSVTPFSSGGGSKPTYLIVNQGNGINVLDFSDFSETYYTNSEMMSGIVQIAPSFHVVFNTIQRNCLTLVADDKLSVSWRRAASYAKEDLELNSGEYHLLWAAAEANGYAVIVCG